MGRCSNDAIPRFIGVNKLTKQSMIYMTVLNDLDTCTCVNAKHGYARGSGSTTGITTYNPYLVPDDAFNCAPDRCRNTGTLTARRTSASEVEYTLDFPIRYDATEFYAGILTFYAYTNTPGTYTITVSIGDPDQADVSTSTGNFDTYSVVVTFDTAGFRPVVIDLSSTPQSTSGDGWNADTRGAIIRFNISSAVTVTTTFGISSICFHDDTTDFETADAVIFQCVEDITRDITLDPVDASCWGQGYDSTSLSVDYSFTAKAATPNYHKLNPLEYLGEATEGWYPASDRKTVEAITLNRVRYGYVQIPEAFEGECGFMYVNIEGLCNQTDSELSRVYSPFPMNITERQFQFITDEYTDLNASTILVHESLIGQDISIQYPRRADVVEYVADDSRINKRRVKLAAPICYNDGTLDLYVYENVLVTAFPQPQTETDEPSWNITISIQRATSDKRFYHRYRITDKA